MSRAEEIHARGLRAVLADEVVADLPPGPGSPRWGLSVIIRPDPATAERLHALTLRLAELAGAGHWRTGCRSSSHVTVASLEPWRPVGHDDPGVDRYAAALARAARRTGPVGFALRGLLLSPGGVMTQALPTDGAADGLRAELRRGLGEDYEGDYRGVTWWVTLLHLTGPVDRPVELVGDVERSRDLALGEFVADAAQLVRYEHRRTDGVPGTVPVPLAEVGLSGEPDRGRVPSGP